MTGIETITDQIEGAQIVSASTDEEGDVWQIVLSNGMCLFVVGGIGLMRIDTEKLH